MSWALVMNVTLFPIPPAHCVPVETSKTLRPVVPALVGPLVVAVRGPSRSGKTALVERLIEECKARGWQVAWVKRTHHTVDIPEKASGRVWTAEPAAMVLHASDRVQVTLPPCEADAGTVIGCVPPGMDLVLLETHSPEPFPTLLSNQLEPEAGEQVVGRFELYGNKEAAAAAMPLIAALLPADSRFDRFLREGLALHGGHGCPGLVLGTRLAMAGLDALGLQAPDRDKRLISVAETDRCALDGIQAVTGCRISRHSLRILDYGKVAATFIDEWTGAAVRVGVRGDLRARVGEGGTPNERHARQRKAYAAWPAEDLFIIKPTELVLSPFEKPDKPLRRVTCAACGEEVSDGREVESESGVRCRPCAAALVMEV